MLSSPFYALRIVLVILIIVLVILALVALHSLPCDIDLVFRWSSPSALLTHPVLFSLPQVFIVIVFESTVLHEGSTVSFEQTCIDFAFATLTFHGFGIVLRSAGSVSAHDAYDLRKQHALSVVVVIIPPSSVSSDPFRNYAVMAISFIDLVSL